MTADLDRANAADDNVFSLGGEDLVRLGAEDLGDVLASVPNLVDSGGSLGAAIRGSDSTGVLNNLPASLGGSRSRVTVDVDGRSLGYFEYVFGEMPLWDVETVSVVRGPLLLTLARPSPDGGIFVRTRGPAPRIESAFRLAAGSFETRAVAGMANFPLAIEGALALRVTAERTTARTSSAIEDIVVGADPNDRERSQLRARIGFDPPGGSVRFVLGASRLETLSVQIVGLRPPYRDRRDLQGGYGVFGIVADTFTAAVDGEFDGGDWSVQASRGHARIDRFAPQGLGQIAATLDDRSLAGALRWRVGSLGLLVGARTESAYQDQTIDIRAIGAGIGAFSDRQTDQGGFAAVHWPLADRFDLHLGARLQHDRQRREGQVTSAIRPDRTLDFTGDWSALLPSVSFIASLSPASELQFTLERGFHPGGLTLNPFSGEQDGFGPERSTHAELALRTRLTDRIGLRANLFRDLITDAQRALIEQREVGGITFEAVRFNNAPRARTQGAELHLDWAIAPRVTISADGAWLATRMLATDVANDPLLGKSFARSPPWSAAARLLWQPTRDWDITIAAHGHGPYFSDDRETATFKIDSAVLFDARAARRFGDIEIAAHVRNLADRFALTYIAVDGLASAAEPREFGVSLTTRRQQARR